MPSLNDLNFLKSRIDSLGGEPQILSRRGEPFPEISITDPSPGSDMDDGSYLDDAAYSDIDDTDISIDSGEEGKTEEINLDDESEFDLESETGDGFESMLDQDVWDDGQAAAPAAKQADMDSDLPPSSDDRVNLESPGFDAGETTEEISKDRDEFEAAEYDQDEDPESETTEEEEFFLADEGLTSPGSQAESEESFDSTEGGFSGGLSESDEEISFPGEIEIGIEADEPLEESAGLSLDEPAGGDSERDQVDFPTDDFDASKNYEGDYFDHEELPDEQPDSRKDAIDKDTFSMEEADFQHLLDSLATLPWNLKSAVEKILADDRWDPDTLKPLIDALVGGALPKTIASHYQKITKRRIELPRSFKRLSGLVLEERQHRLVYRLIKEGRPVLYWTLGLVATLWLLTIVVFMWVYRPLKAESLYRKGLDRIEQDDVDGAVEKFNDGWNGWPLFDTPEGARRTGDAPIVVKGWKNTERMLDYARALAGRKYLTEAAEFYESFLTVDPAGKEGRLEYADFLSRRMGEFQRAADVLKDAPPGMFGKIDRDYTLALGDVHLEWGATDPDRYEDARFYYAKALETSRNDERAVLSMMRYHLLLGNNEEVEKLLPVFADDEPGHTQEGELAAEVFSRLGDFNRVRGRMSEARRFLDLALAVQSASAYPDFSDALYWREMNDLPREREALERTITRLENRDFLDSDAGSMLILSYGRLAHVYVRTSYAASDFSDSRSLMRTATELYARALNLFESAYAQHEMGALPEIGIFYIQLADVYYSNYGFDEDPGASEAQFTLSQTPDRVYPGDGRYDTLSLAETYYNRAEGILGYATGRSRLPDRALFRRGYARFRLGKDGAVMDLNRAARRRPDDYEIRLTLGSVLLDSRDYGAARIQYTRALKLMDDKRRRIGILEPERYDTHRNMLLRYIVAWNNLGVASALSAGRNGREDGYATALGAFTLASEYLEDMGTWNGEDRSLNIPALRDADSKRIVDEDDEQNRYTLREKETAPYRNRQKLLGLESAGPSGTPDYLIYTDIPTGLSAGGNI